MVRRTFALLVALFAVAALGTTPAHAGGPTSVLLSAPPHVVAVGYEDEAYGELQRLIDNPGTRSAGDPEEHMSGNFVRATWLIHDMSVWRIDIIYPDAPGGPWILSENTLDGSGKPVWHRSTNPVQLVQLLSGLKLLSGEFQGGPTLVDDFTLESPPPQTVQPEPVQPAQATASTSAFAGWRWIIPGVLLGAAAAMLYLRLFPKRRWELLD